MRLSLNKVLLLPPNEARRLGRKAVEDLELFFSGKRPKDVINPKQLPIMA